MASVREIATGSSSVSHRGLTTAVFLVLVAGACAPRADRATDDPLPASALELTLTVRNFDFNQLTVYALGGVRRERVGIVQSNSEETFRFRWSQPQIQLEISLLAAGSTRTEVMPVSAGDELRLEVQVSSAGRPVVRRVR